MDGVGFDFDGGVTNSVMQYNYSHDNDAAGFLRAQYAFAPQPMKNIGSRILVIQVDPMLVAPGTGGTLRNPDLLRSPPINLRTELEPQMDADRHGFSAGYNKRWIHPKDEESDPCNSFLISVHPCVSVVLFSSLARKAHKGKIK